MSLKPVLAESESVHSEDVMGANDETNPVKMRNQVVGGSFAELSEQAKTDMPEIDRAKSLDELIADPTIQVVLRIAGISDPRLYTYFDIDRGETITRSMAVQEVMELARELNPNNFDATKPPTSDPAKMLNWLKWANTGFLTYDEDITPEMVERALHVAEILHLPMDKLSQSQIMLANKISDDEIRDMVDRANQPDIIDKMESEILNTSGILSKEEMRIMKAAAQRYRIGKRSENPLFAPDHLRKYLDQVDITVGKRFDAHGIARQYDLDALNYLLSHGPSEKKQFYTCPLVMDSGAAASIGADGPYSDGGFIVIGHPDILIKDGGIATVLVNEHYYEVIPLLAEKFPLIKFIKAEEMKEELEKILKEGI